MECPDCGYDVESTANFCPQCRHPPFRDTGPESGGHSPGPGTEGQEPAPVNDEVPERFSVKELRHLKVHLLQPSLFVVAGVAMTGYVMVPQVQEYSLELLVCSFP